MAERPHDNWASGDAYEAYVGRWSRVVAREFVQWLAVPAGSRWLDVGCGTGALTQVILQLAAPRAIKGVDRSEDFVAHAQEQVRDRRAAFEVGEAQSLPDETASYDALVSGLMLNFLPQPELAVGEMRRLARPDGVVSAYVWDYAGEMQMMRHFWEAAVGMDAAAGALDEGRRFPLCRPEALAGLFQRAGLKDVAVRAVDVPTTFKDFDDYWSPFLGGQGPAPGYAMSLTAEQRAALRERIRAGLPFASDGSIPLVARAWAVRGVRQ